ncbi:MAG TPA: PC4/YdbC family ssDNA-binding protein [bacterium]|nr:PC4/YdbC family ssDNA-binding protein [bacterium]HPH52999.1 PC4/YdbC family ssDNA-binding protein [Bacteroidales bacterium]
MARNEQLKFEIVQNIAVLSTSKSGWTKEINMVSYNGAPAKYDIRSWDPNHEKMGKGITLTKEELVQLESVLRELL